MVIRTWDLPKTKLNHYLLDLDLQSECAYCDILWALQIWRARCVYLHPKTSSARDRKKTYEILWRRVPHLDTIKWTELCISFRTITHSNYGKKESKSKTKKKLKIKESTRKKFSQIFQCISWHLQERKLQHLKQKITNNNTNASRKKGERANVHACVRAHVCV